MEGKIMARKVVLAGACRTAIGTMGGSLSAVPAAELGAVFRSVCEKSQDHYLKFICFICNMLSWFCSVFYADIFCSNPGNNLIYLK